VQRRPPWALLSAACIAGPLCPTTSAVSGNSPAPAWISADESIVVLQSPRFYFDWENHKVPLDIDLFQCATRELHAKYPRVHLVPQEKFVKIAFPDLNPKAAPVSPESMKLLLGNPTLQSRIAPIKVRYLVYAGTENDIEDVLPFFMGCVGSYGGALCGGGAEWHKRSAYDLVVVDLKNHHESNAANTVEGTSWFASILPLVVGWKSPTEARACHALGRDLLHLFETPARPALAYPRPTESAP